MKVMNTCLWALCALISFVTIIKAQNLEEERPVGFHLNYEEGEKNTFDYTPNGCRILGKLFSPDASEPKQKKKSPMAEMPVLKEQWMRKGNHTTVLKKVKPPQNTKPRKQNSTPVSQQANFDLTQAVPAGADSSKPVVSFALQAKVYSKDLTILSWSYEEERYKLAVNRNLIHLSSITAYESPKTTYLFFYLPEDLRESGSGQRNKPEVPTWGNKKGLQTYLLEGDETNLEALDCVAALLELHKAHKKDLKQIYRDFKKRQKELEKLPKIKAPEPTETMIQYSISNIK